MMLDQVKSAGQICLLLSGKVYSTNRGNINKCGGLDRTNDELLIFPALIGIMIVVIAFDDFCKGIRLVKISICIHFKIL